MAGQCELLLQFLLLLLENVATGGSSLVGVLRTIRVGFRGSIAASKDVIDAHTVEISSEVVQKKVFTSHALCKNAGVKHLQMKLACLDEFAGGHHG